MSVKQLAKDLHSVMPGAAEMLDKTKALCSQAVESSMREELTLTTL